MANEQTAKDSFFAEAEIISSYTRAQAIEDGILVDLSDNEVIEQHFKFPVAITAAVWDIIEKAISNKKYMNDLNGVIADICWMARVGARRISESARLFEVIIRGVGKKSKFTMKIVCGPGDDLKPVLTIMMPNED